MENKNKMENENNRKEYITRSLEDYNKAFYNIDMVEGFVNIGAMADPKYNALVPEQLKLMEYFADSNESINFIGEGHDEAALEFDTYPVHCVKGTKEAEFIEDFKDYLYIPNTRIYRKNSINGMLNDDLRADILKMTNLKEAVFTGVCEDLCVMDFVRTYARYMDEINRKVNLFVVANAVDTFDAEYHNREEWKRIAKVVMEQAGAIYVQDFHELKEREKTLGLYR